MPMRPAEQQWLLLEAAADATLVVGRDGLINRANRRTAEILGWQPAELIGQSVEVLVPPASRTAHSSFRKAFVASPRPRMMG
ncbi:MAG: PAS domain-containing protein, partial [Actinobacteria bacterium]|nr:PAS domain-containing protein [Actinomycetota bacterium]